MSGGGAPWAARPGIWYPLGATIRDGGTNFAVASGMADGMLLCLFDEEGAETRIPMPDRDGGVWHAFVPGVGAGQAYGYRATSPYDPGRGARCNPAKLLLDPYALATTDEARFGPEVLEFRPSCAGTYAGLGHREAIAHLLDLGVTAVDCSRCTSTCPRPSSPITA